MRYENAKDTDAGFIQKYVWDKQYGDIAVSCVYTFWTKFVSEQDFSFKFSANETIDLTVLN